MSKIQLLIGTIASGKSSFAKLQALNGWLTINDDSVVNAYHGGVYEKYEKNLKLVYKSTELQMAAMALAAGRNLVIDNGTSNLNVEGRQRWVSLARAWDTDIEAVVFPWEKDINVHAERRVNHDSRGLPLHEWQRNVQEHKKKYQPPTKDEGFKEIYFIPEMKK